MQIHLDHTPVSNIELEGVYNLLLWTNGIIELNWKKELDEISLDHLRSLKDDIKTLGNGKRMPIIVNAEDFIHTTDEGKKYSASEEGQTYTLANAIIVDNLGKRILFNFFCKLYKPVRPIKAFNDKESATYWLLNTRFKD